MNIKNLMDRKFTWFILGMMTLPILWMILISIGNFIFGPQPEDVIPHHTLVEFHRIECMGMPWDYSYTIKGIGTKEEFEQAVNTLGFQDRKVSETFYGDESPSPKRQEYIEYKDGWVIYHESVQ